MRKMFSKKQIEEMIKEGQKSPTLTEIFKDEFTADADTTSYISSDTISKLEEGKVYYLSFRDYDADEAIASGFISFISGEISEWRFVLFNETNEYCIAEVSFTSKKLRIMLVSGASLYDGTTYLLQLFKLQ